MGLQQEYILYRDGSYPFYYCCHYLPVTAGNDPISHSLLKFKEGQQPDLDSWIRGSLKMLAAAPTPQPIPPGTLIIRALHHQETSAPSPGSPSAPSPSPGSSSFPSSSPSHPPPSLDLLGNALASHFHSHYLPGLLEKRSPCRAIKEFTRPRREEELRDLYTITPLHAKTLASAPSLLIIDDVLTTGTTVKMIIETLRQATPAPRIRIFTLAKAIYNIYNI